MLVGSLGGRTSAIRGGIGLALASLKLHPASLGGWFLLRGWRERASNGSIAVATAAGLGIAIVAASVVIGGIALWTDYVEVVRAGTGAVIVDRRNAGIAAQLAMAIGGGDALARSLHIVVAVAAVVVTVWAAWRRRDALESFAWAAAASLSTLPVTWYHYPSALIPVAIAAWLRVGAVRARRVVGALIAAEVLAVMALVWLPLLWPAIGLVILAARWSATDAPVRPAHGDG
jgi:hypothetical protein